MSTQQIPTVAQIAAARSALWHQANTEAETEAFSPGIAPELNTAVEPAVATNEEATGSSDVLEANSSVSHVEPAESTEAASGESSSSSGPDRKDSLKPSQPDSPAILTQSAARDFLNRAGLLLFAARPQLAGVPAPTFVEATLGLPNANPSLAASETARTLLGHLVADGSAVPLNLLGLPTTTGEAPDFIVSAAAFPYVFTLRGDKAWKQPPVTSGPTKVSPLAANTYTLLVEDGPQTAYALAGALGKEVTEAAVLRALSELWQQLRVLPVLQGKGKPALWELITARFTKGIKAGANAGQPTALSTLISLFLGQAILATEDEIETFLSPLAPRSRVRDVLHALSAARQLETMTVEGKHHLHVAGDLPLFTSAEEKPAESLQLAEDGSRIKKFVAKPRKLGTGFVPRAKPFRAPSDRAESRSKDRFESRPVRKPAAKRFSSEGSGPAFNKPWEEEKQERAARQAGGPPEFQGLDLDASAPPASERTRSAPGAGKPIFSRKPGFGSKPGFGDRPRTGGDRPAFNRDRPGADRRPRDGGSDSSAPRSPRRDFAARDGDSRPPRKAFGSKPAFGTRPAFPRKPFDADRAAGDRERRPFRREGDSGESRPPRRTFDSGLRSSAQGENRPPFAGKPRFSPGRDGDSAGGRPPFRKFDAPRTPHPPREEGDARPPRHTFEGGRPSPGGQSNFGGSRPFEKKPFVRRDPGERSSTDGAPSRRPGFGAREGSFPRREGTSAGPRQEGEKRSFSPRSGDSAGTGRPAPRKPFSRSSPDAPGANTFDKFKGGNKPWGKRPPARKFKPKGNGA